MSIPSNQVSSYETRLDAEAGLDAGGTPTHLTMSELARRWRRQRKTVERGYAKWGLRPLRFGGRLLFPFSQVLEAEQRAMAGEFVSTEQEKV